MFAGQVDAYVGGKTMDETLRFTEFGSDSSRVRNDAGVFHSTTGDSDDATRRMLSRGTRS